MPLCTCRNFDSSKCTEAFTPLRLCAAVMRSKNCVPLFSLREPLYILCGRADITHMSFNFMACVVIAVVGTRNPRDHRLIKNRCVTS